jgi:hypothetical protein
MWPVNIADFTRACWRVVKTPNSLNEGIAHRTIKKIIWHHEGRRARHGTSMMGPDYTYWHGTYEVAKLLYRVHT